MRASNTFAPFYTRLIAIFLVQVAQSQQQTCYRGMKPRVAVIGAGLAGVSCATRLIGNSIADHVHIFDKARGSGGRMSTRRGDGWACDHGAQYFTASSPLFSETVAAWQSAGVCEKWGGLIKVFNGSGWDNLKHSTDRFVGTPKMKSPVEYMLNNSGFTVHTTALVEELKRTESGKWDLRLSRDGGKNSNWEANGAEENMFDIVVVAAPSPQAHVLVKFHSLVLAETASAAVMKGCWAVMVRPSLRLQLPFDGAFINGGPLSWISRDSSKPGRHPDKDTWLLHGTMKWSEEHIEDLPADIAAQLVAEFSQITGVSMNLESVEWSTHRWRFATTHPNLDIGSVWDPDQKIGMCGDWLDVGKIEGAWKSGVHLADLIQSSWK